MCSMLEISSSSYYQWLNGKSSKRWNENVVLVSEIKEIFEDSYCSYGSPRVTAELK